MIRTVSISALMIAGSWAAMPALAQPKTDPDWPCVQRKVASLAAGTIWSGPNPEEAGPWGSDFQAAALAQKLASRRTPLSEIEGLVAAFAAEAGPEKRERLTRVFAGALELINSERQRIISGIERYARGQRGLAERIREEADKITAVKDSPAAATPKDFEELESRSPGTSVSSTNDRRRFNMSAKPRFSLSKTSEIAKQLQSRLS